MLLSPTLASLFMPSPYYNPVAMTGSPSNWNSGHVPDISLTERVSNHEASVDGQTDIATASAGRSGISNVVASHQGTPSFPIQALGASSQLFDDPPYVPPRISQAELSTYPALDPRAVAVTTYASNQHAHSLAVPSQQYPYDTVTSPSDSIESWSASSSSSAASQDYLVDHLSHATLPQRHTTYYPAYQGPYRHGLEHIKYGSYPSNAGGTYYRNQPQGPSLISPEIFDGQFHHPATSSLPSSINQSHTFSASSVSPDPFINEPPIESADPTGSYLRQQLGLAAHQPVTLWSIPEPPSGEKPSTPLPMLVKLAIYGSPKKQLTLQEIYTELENRFQWFRDHKKEAAWKNSIRHNLSLNKVFVHVPRPITEPGKGNYWRLDVSGGEGYKRSRKRRPKNRQVVSEEEDEDTSEIDEERPGPSHHAGSRSTPAEDTNIDPELRVEGHVVGEGRTRPGTRRAAAVGGIPYPHQSPRYQQGSLPVVAGEQDASVGPGVPGQPAIRFGQPSFGQPSFPAFAQSQAMATVAPLTPTAVPFAAVAAMTQAVPVASRTQAPPVASSAYDRNMHITVQPTQRPGVAYLMDPAGLPIARRVETALLPNSQEQSPGDTAGASPKSTSSSSSKTWSDARLRPQAQG